MEKRHRKPHGNFDKMDIEEMTGSRAQKRKAPPQNGLAEGSQERRKMTCRSSVAQCVRRKEAEAKNDCRRC